MARSPHEDLIRRARSGIAADKEQLADRIRSLLAHRWADDSAQEPPDCHPAEARIDLAMSVLQKQLASFSGSTEDELLQWLDERIAAIERRADDDTIHHQATQIDKPGTLDETQLEQPPDTSMATDVTMVRPLGTAAKTVGPGDATIDTSPDDDIHHQETLDGATATNVHAAPTVGAVSPDGKSTPGGRPFGDYELLSLIAKGGMGVVYRARQRKLNRIVALKMILAGQFADDVDVKRFYGEAEAAAKLRHRNIVGIHEVGECEGQHFFSMEFIDGQSLSALVRENPLPPQQAAMLVKDIALAMQYAHDHDVLHRDLKPSNILLDETQEPMITDFGLAKQVEGQSQLTMSGAVVGTPSYMPPEQASAQTDKVGVGSDVYSIGAILYELLTGAPPFRAATPFETIRQVLEREPISPRVLDSSIPVDLETICLKCLQKEPAARYSSAQDLADELSRFLLGEPIKARPIGPIHRLWRRCKQNPVVASLSVVAVTLLIAFVVNLVRSNITTRHLLAKTDLALQETLKTVNDLFVIVSESRLLNTPGAKGLREELLVKARDIYKRIHTRETNDPRIQHQLALSHYRVGRILAELRSPAEAKDSYERAMRMQARLVEDNPDDLDLLLELSDTQNFLGVLEGGALEEPQIGLKWFEEVKSHRRTLVAKAADNYEYRRKLASVHMSCGLMHKKLGNEEEASQEFQFAQQERIEIRDKLLALIDPTDEESNELNILTRVNRDLATGYHNLGLLARRKLENSLDVIHQETQPRITNKKWDDARLQKHVKIAVAARRETIGHYKSAVEAVQAALKLDPDDMENKFRMAVFERVLGNAKNTDVVEETEKKNAQGERLVIEHAISDWKVVKGHFETSQRILQQLVDNNPKVHEYRYALAGLQLPLARLYCDMQQVPLGFATYAKSIENYERLVTTKGLENIPKYRFELAKTKRDLAYQQTVSVENMQLSAKLSDWEKPLQLCRESRTLISRLVIDYPQVKEYKTELEKVDFDRFDLAKALAKSAVARAATLAKKNDATQAEWEQARSFLDRAKQLFDELVSLYKGNKAVLVDFEKGAEGYQKAKTYFEKMRGGS